MTQYESRREYQHGALDEGSVAADPVQQFRDWFEQATEDARIDEPSAMTLATADREHGPSARIVLLREVRDDGFVFYTNYQSRKGEELARDPRCALLFYWGPLERQIRIEGQVRPLAAEESDRYFGSRPFRSKLGALASAQSQPIPGRAALEDEMDRLAERFPEGSSVPRPPHWGGYLVVPQTFEFWQGRRSRLHDRVRYRRRADGASWQIDRLSP